MKIEIFDGPIPAEEVCSRWFLSQHKKNFGAFIPFFGIIREEDGISALSFDIYEPLLEKWFADWQEKASEKKALLVMAHSRGDVPLHKVSFMAGIFSVKRRVGLEMIDEFVEDFKANAPIWKYDVIEGKRIYAEERSAKLPYAGLLGTL